MTATTGQLRLRTFEHFSDIPPSLAGEIISKLGLPGGRMRRCALQRDPKTIVAFTRWFSDTDEYDGKGDYWKPRAWLIVFRTTRPVRQRPAMMLFVAKPHRGQGIGTKLVTRALKRWNLYGKAISTFHDNAGVTEFYRKAGLE